MRHHSETGGKRVSGVRTAFTVEGVALAARSQGQWLAVIAKGQALELWLLDSAGNLTSKGSIPGTGNLSLAVSADEAAVVWQQEGSIFWSRIPNTWVPTPSVELARVSVSTTPAIAGEANGYAVGWVNSSGFSISQYLKGGSVRCPPTQIEVGDGSMDRNDHLSLASDGDHVYALATRKTGEVSFAIFDHECQTVQLHEVTSTAALPKWPSVAVGGGELALAWTETPVAGRYEVQTRVLSSRGCD